MWVPLVVFRLNIGYYQKIYHYGEGCGVVVIDQHPKFYLCHTDTVDTVVLNGYYVTTVRVLQFTLFCMSLRKELFCSLSNTSLVLATANGTVRTIAAFAQFVPANNLWLRALLRFHAIELVIREVQRTIVILAHNSPIVILP